MKKFSFLRYILVIIPLIIVILLAGPLRRQLTIWAGLNPDAVSQKTIAEPGAASTPQPEVIQKAVDQAISQLKKSDQGYALYDAKVDNVIMSEDGKKAVIWLAPIDPDTGNVIAREPDLAIAELPEKDPKNPKAIPEWNVTLQQQSGYEEKAASIPLNLWGEEGSEFSQPKTIQNDTAKGLKFGGYYLPWGGGLSKQVTWSIGHTSCADNACHYAFDFADGTNFPLQAAKGGVVFAAKWNCNNGSTSCTNMFIIKDQSTTPTTYQIYYHLAKDSIPAALRTPGALVNQGQFIGNADDTGASTASHLHFMVHANPYGYWGTSVDITFLDVKINWDAATKGGRPRTPAEAKKYGGEGQYAYVSGNRAAKGPTGNITAPAFGSVVASQSMVVAGSASDDTGVTRAQLIANYDGTWKEVGPSITSVPFSVPVDVCAAGNEIPDGVFSLALRIWDKEGNQSAGLPGLRQMVKKFTCGQTAKPTPPPCNPSADQAALYAGTNYSGSCKLLKVADYVNRAAVANFALQNTSSILLGSNVQATLYSKASYLGRAETLVASDPDLSDNLINYYDLLSLQIKPLSQAAAVPLIFAPKSTSSLTTADSITLQWNNRGSANIFQAELSGDPAGFTTRTRDYSPMTDWSIGSLPAGTYTWKVRGRNTANGTESTWATETFTVTAAAVATNTPRPAPFSDNVESGVNGWTTTGLWKQTTTQSSSASHSWWFGDASSRYTNIDVGTLTSPQISVLEKGYYLRFDYSYHTEAITPYKDQRIIQVAVNGGPFTDVYQLYDDPVDTWLQSPGIDLSAYAGKTIQVRFYFNALDSYLNSYAGWYIDNINITKTAPTTGCNEPSNNNGLLSATPLTIGTNIPGDICPSGDQDFFKFTATAGQKVTFDVDAKTLNSKLDPTLTLYGKNGYTVLAFNDDEVAFKVKDSLITYTFPEDGTYYLKLSAWNHPSAGGSEYFYTLKSYSDTVGPNITISYPASNTTLPNGQIAVSIGGDDGQGGSGIAKMVLYYHDSDWTAGVWKKIGEDTAGSDGWSVPFDPRKESNGSSGALYAQVFDNAGNWTPAVSWNLKLDNTQAPPAEPASEMVPMSSTSNINTVLLQWNATGNLSAITHFEIQYQKDGGAWQAWPYEVPDVSKRYAWFIGELGSTYGFRIRAANASNGGETFPDAAETSVQLTGCTAGVDTFEPDNSQAQAKDLTMSADRQNHTFCGQNDTDWLKYTPQADQMYIFQALPTSSADGVIITLMDKAGNVISEAAPKALGQSTYIKYDATSSDPVYLKLRNYNPQIAGDGVTYQFWVDQGQQFFVPMVAP